MRLLIIALMLLLVAVSGLPASAGPAASAQSDLVALINVYRSSIGLASLATSPTLSAAAQWMASDMASKNYFSHTSLDGRSPQARMAAFGYPAYATWTGEDLAAGSTTAAGTLVQWQNSAAHNAVLTSANYRAVGIGIAYSATSTYKWYWVADFGGIADGAAPQPLATAPRIVTPASGPAAGTFTEASADSGFHAQFVEQRSPLSLPPEEIGTFAIAFRNTGSRAWVRGRAGEEARLGTRDPLDGAYPELAVDWPSANRLAAQDRERIEVGEVGWFTFRLRAPSASGTYRLRVRPVVDGTAWLEDVGAFFEIRVVLAPRLQAV